MEVFQAVDGLDGQGVDAAVDAGRDEKAEAEANRVSYQGAMMLTFPHGVIANCSNEKLLELRDNLQAATGNVWAIGRYNGRPCFWFKEQSRAVGFILMSGGGYISLAERE